MNDRHRLEKRERDLRILRRVSVLLSRSAERCADPEEAEVPRCTEREVRRLVDRLEAGH
jgi:hypothetical protein